MALLNYTTKIDADKTAAEIARCLSQHGASSVMTDYRDNILVAVSFKINLNGRELGFRLPCDWKPVLAVMDRDYRAGKMSKKLGRPDELWAVRVAWRIVKDWVEAQMALVETQMVTTQQVFLPYAVMHDNRTLTEHIAENPALLLGDGK